MRKVVLFKIGGKKVHLLKVVGALVALGSAFGVLRAVSMFFTLSSQVGLAKSNSEVSMSVFGLLPQSLTDAVLLGHFMEPLVWLFLWLGLLVLGVLVYRSGNIVIPVEEEIRKEEE